MTSPGRGLVMLQRRAEFLRIRNGLRWASATFVLEAKSRAGWSRPVPIAADLTRFGLTVTKQLGGAVERNRIRRRLRSALRQTAAQYATPGFDYVFIARADARTIPFSQLVCEMGTALQAVHTRRPQSKSPKRGKPSGNSSPS